MMAKAFEEPEAMAPEEPATQAAHNVTSASAGTAIVTGAGTITSITLAALPVVTDGRTQLSLIDSADGSPGPTLFAADLQTLMNYLVEPRPGVALTPGTTAPTWPKTIASLVTSFTRGLWVKSCPVGPTFVVNA